MIPATGLRPRRATRNHMTKTAILNNKTTRGSRLTFERLFSWNPLRKEAASHTPRGRTMNNASQPRSPALPRRLDAAAPSRAGRITLTRAVGTGLRPARSFPVLEENQESYVVRH